MEEPTLEKGTAFAITRSLAPCSGHSAAPYDIDIGDCRLVTLEIRADGLSTYEDVLHLKNDDPKRSDLAVKIKAHGASGALQVCVSSATGGDGDTLDRCSSASRRSLPLDFGPLSLGGASIRRRVQLTNTGEVDLVVDSIEPRSEDLPDIAVDPSNFRMVLAPGDVAEAKVVYRPTTIGARTGLVTVTGDDPLTAPVLLEIGAQGDGAKLCLDPSSLDFGTIAVGSTSDAKTVTLKNCGTKALTTSALAIDGGDFVFAVTPPPAGESPPGAKVLANLQFKPMSVGTKNGKLKAPSNDPAAPLQFVPLTGNAIPPSICKLEASTAILDFGVQVQGSQTYRQLILHNAGNSDCTVKAAAIDVPGTSTRFYIAVSPPPPFVLRPNKTQAIDVGYQPLDANPPDTGVLTFQSDDPVKSLFTVQLNGVPTPTPECRLEITPPGPGRKLNFGVVAIGDKKTLPMTLKNIGSADCTVGNPTFAHTMPLMSPDSAFKFGTFTPTLPSTLKPGETQTMNVVYQPTGATDPFPIGNTYFWFNTNENKGSECTGNTTTGCKATTVKGTGVVLAIDTVPNKIDFGLVTVGCGSVDKVVTIYNVGDASVELQGFEIDPVTAPFTIVQKPNVPVTLNPGAQVTVTVKYRPTAAAPDTGTLVIKHNFSSGESTVALKGEGTTQAHQIDTFTQNTNPKTDVLWVIDNSESMSPKQSFLSQNARTFIQQANLTNNDYQVAVIATEWSGTADTGFPHKAASSSAYPGANIWPGEFFGQPQVIRRTDTDPEGELSKNIRVGDVGSATAESGLEAAKAALTNPLIGDPAKPNSTFVREDAKLAIIVLSDEEDQGASKNVQYYIDLFQNLKGAHNTQMFSFHAIAGDPSNGCDATVSGNTIHGDPAPRYKEATTLGNGIFKSICATDWGSIAQDIGLDAFTPRLQYTLSRACDIATLKVKVNGVQQSAGVDYDYESASNSIVFRTASSPPAGSTITAEYDAACL
ncbi:MAG: choice-of-anchor D domain-containing protein [Myxococcales bacterium]